MRSLFKIFHKNFFFWKPWVVNNKFVNFLKFFIHNIWYVSCSFIKNKFLSWRVQNFFFLFFLFSNLLFNYYWLIIVLLFYFWFMRLKNFFFLISFRFLRSLIKFCSLFFHSLSKSFEMLSQPSKASLAMLPWSS